MTIVEMRMALTVLLQKLERLKEVDSVISCLDDEQRELSVREQTLNTAILKEENNIKRMEGLTVTSFIHSLFGNEHQQLSDAKQRANDIKLQHHSIILRIDECKIRLDGLHGERNALSDAAEGYKQLHADLLKALHEDPIYNDRLCILERQHGEAEVRLMEVAEAIECGNDVIQHADSILTILNDARRASSKLAYHDMAYHYMIKTQDGIQALQQRISRFLEALAKVRIAKRFLEVIRDYSKTEMPNIDLYSGYDTLIRDTDESVLDVQNTVHTVLSELCVLQLKWDSRKSDLEKQLDNLIMRA